MDESKNGETIKEKSELNLRSKMPQESEIKKTISSEVAEESKKEQLEELEKKLSGFLALDDENRIQDVLNEVVGRELEKGDLGRVLELLEEKAGSLINRIANKLLEKYKGKEIYISNVLEDPTSFNEMVNDSMDLIESEVAEEVKNCYNELQVRRELKMNPRGADSQKNSDGSGNRKVVFLMERRKGREGEKMTVNKSRETLEQKEMKEKIRRAIQEVVRESIARVESLLKKEKKKGVQGLDEEKVKNGMKKAESVVLENIDGYADLIFQFLKDKQESSYIDQLMHLEARRLVAEVFRSDREIRKILPETDFSKIKPKRFLGGKAESKAKKKESIISGLSEESRVGNLEEIIKESPTLAPIETEETNWNSANQQDQVDLSEEEMTRYQSLEERAGIKELETQLKKKQEKIKSTEKEIQRNKDIFSALLKVLKEIARGRHFDLDYFREYFLNPLIWEDYFEEMEKRKKEEIMTDSGDDLRNYKEEFIEEIKGYADRAGYNEEEKKLIERYFRSRLLLESFLRK